MYSSFEFEGITIGKGDEPLVIPEMGINHEGSLSVAKEIVDAACHAGARIIKHQTHVVEDEMSGAARRVIPGNSKDSIYDIMKRCALSEEDEYELMQYVKSKGMVFLSTPFSRAAADRLHRFGVSAYKIGSGELNNYPLVRHIASYGKPMIVSTGMNDISAIRKTVDIMEEYNIPYALMHTTNLYPTEPHMVRLGAMCEMMKAFPGVSIGLSDHTLNNFACISAIALGADLVERHFIDRKDRPGPDVICSMNSKECMELIDAAHDIPLMLGGTKKALAEEQVTMDFAFATVVSIKNIRKGELFSKENLWVKRPGTGTIKAENYDSLLGRTAACDIENDTQISWNMIVDG
ncbi:MAG: N-acetylneuraminate synthase family protein [Lachnospiraceae bacterium]|nr:N-acetylneuraminate synthase family protein [Lachnospiraceae bacterium]